MILIICELYQQARQFADAMGLPESVSRPAWQWVSHENHYRFGGMRAGTVCFNLHDCMPENADRRELLKDVRGDFIGRRFQVFDAALGAFE